MVVGENMLVVVNEKGNMVIVAIVVNENMLV